MKDRNRPLRRVIARARDAKPDAPLPPDAVRDFAERTVSAWKRRPTTVTPPDPWRLWERVGNWSLASAAAAVGFLLLVQPQPPPPKPLAPFGPVESAELNLL